MEEIDRGEHMKNKQNHNKQNDEARFVRSPLSASARLHSAGDNGGNLSLVLGSKPTFVHLKYKEMTLEREEI